MDKLNFNVEEKRPGEEGNSHKSSTHDSFENICGIKLHNRGRLNGMTVEAIQGVSQPQNKHLPTSNETGDFLKNQST